MNYKATEIGKIAEIGKHFENGKAFLHDALALTSCEISVNEMPKGAKLPFSHRHKQNEEIYIFLKGSGTMTVDDRKVPFREGTCVKVLPAGARTIETDADTEYICVQAKTDSLEQFGFGDGELC